MRIGMGHRSENGFGLKSDSRQVIEAQRLLDKATDGFRRLQELQQTRTVQWQAASQPLAVASHGKPCGMQLLDYDGPEPTLLKGEKNLVDAIENGGALAKSWTSIPHRPQRPFPSKAPFPSKHAKACMCDIVEQLATRGDGDETTSCIAGAAFAWPQPAPALHWQVRVTITDRTVGH